MSIGRKSRLIPKAIERAVRSRDNDTCTFPGCRNHRFLHCHHVEHWSIGGETSIDNLLLLCTKHHPLVHVGGFSIDKDFQDNWCFKRPDGIGVPAVGYVSGLYENPPAGGLLSVAENSTREPPLETRIFLPNAAAEASMSDPIPSSRRGLYSPGPPGLSP